MLKQYVIIGNGIAAAGCIEGIRSVDKEGSITVVSEENHAAYCRPLISYYLGGKTDLSRINYRSDDFYAQMKCEVLYGRRAIRIDTLKKAVILDDGICLPYSSVCVATGSSAFVPAFEGLETVVNKSTFMTLDDALTIEAGISQTSKILIIGAGLIGLKCAEGLCGRVSDITVCDLSDRVLSSILDAECAEIMQKQLENHGLHFMLGDSVVRFDKNKAFMKSGKTLNFDMLILAVGVRANTALVKEIGGEVNRGIIVDKYMRTTVDDIYSAGDCTEGLDTSCGSKRVLAILPNAYMQGHAAGINMGGGTEAFDNAIPMNSIGFFGLHAMTAGSYDGEMYEVKSENRLKRLFIRDGRLVGFIIVGEPERAGIYTSFIREKTSLESFDLDLLLKSATTAAFPSEKREKIFGGVI